MMLDKETFNELVRITIQSPLVIVLGIPTYLIFGCYATNRFWDYSARFEKRFSRYASRSAFLALLWAPAVIGCEGGAFPAPALIALIYYLPGFFQPGYSLYNEFTLFVLYFVGAPVVAFWLLGVAIGYINGKGKSAS